MLKYVINFFLIHAHGLKCYFIDSPLTCPYSSIPIKSTKIKVSFVELKDTIPVHGPESEVFENLMWEGFIALLDSKVKACCCLPSKWNNPRR